MKKSFYFPHDYNSANDVKCLFLRQSLGMEGYGVFWFLVEQLANSGGSLPLNIIPVLSMQMQVPEVKVQAVITKFDLFEIDEQNHFFSNRLNEHLDIRKELSENGKKGADARWNNSHAISHPISPAIGGAYAKEKKESKVKEIKGNESKEKKESSFFSLEEILLKFEKNELLKRPYFNRMAEIHSIPDSKVKEHFKKWALLKEGTPMTLSHAENSFNIYLGNLKAEKIPATKQQGRNIFSELLQEENAKTKNQ